MIRAPPRFLAIAASLTACYLPGRPAFRPIDVDNDVAVQTWLDDGHPLALTHGYLDDQVEITVSLGEEAGAMVTVTVSVWNESPHDVLLDFAASRLEGFPSHAWSPADTAYSIERDGWSAEWRVAPGETGTFRASYRQSEEVGSVPDAVVVTLRGFIGSLTLSDSFEFARIEWP